MKTASIAWLAVAVVAAYAADLDLIQPKDLAARVAANPTIFQVGPNVLYRSKHIPSAIYAGPAVDPKGLALLKAAAEKLPHGEEVVIYCGCCPWDRCPNVKPAVELLQQMGFKKVKVLHLPDSFAKNWIDQGYPVESSVAK